MVKKKKPAPAPQRQPQVITIPADPNATWSFELPVKLKIAIADAVTLFGRLDNAVIEVLWADEQADLARKKKIAKEFAADNIEFMAARIKERLGVDTPDIWTSLTRMRRERNLIAHGVWMVTDGEKPMVLWHSKMLESDDYVSFEPFPYHRFEHFATKAAHLLNTFNIYREMLHKIAEIKRREAAEAAAAQAAQPAPPPAGDAGDPPPQ
jgi:hypothetical protein